jgi:hypothetical protein
MNREGLKSRKIVINEEWFILLFQSGFCGYGSVINGQDLNYISVNNYSFK